MQPKDECLLEENWLIFAEFLKTETTHLVQYAFATTNALAQGIRIDVVSWMLGHTNIKTTRI